MKYHLIRLTSNMKEITDIPRNKMLEAILELGRNWALAVAIASAGTAAFYTETVDGPVQWERWVFLTCIFLSLIWMIFATLRFDEVASFKFRKKGKLHLALVAVLLIVVLSAGVGTVLVVGKFADNNQIVKTCDSKSHEPESRIYKASECVRLREQRQAKLDRLEGK